MSLLSLGIVVLQTNSLMTMTILDVSVYPTDPPDVISPKIIIGVPGFGEVELPFTPKDHNTYNSTNLGLTQLGSECPLPDGIYTIRYTVVPYAENFVEQSILKIDKLQSKFDNAFLTLDMMECDSAVKKQSFVQLSTIYLFIQGAVAAANNCSTVESSKLYKQASTLLNTFIKQDCGCSGNNFLTNFN